MLHEIFTFFIINDSHFLCLDLFLSSWVFPSAVMWSLRCFGSSWYLNYVQMTTIPQRWKPSCIHPSWTKVCCFITQLAATSPALPILPWGCAPQNNFGQAFLWDDKPMKTQLNTPCIYTAPWPEIIFHNHISPAVDVWALAVLEPYGGSLLFTSYNGIKKEVLREMVLTLGELPDRWWTKWEDKSEYFDENGTFIGDMTKLPPVSGKFLKIPSGQDGNGGA